MSETYSIGSLEYKMVSTRTIEGLRKAERLKDQGWRICSVGLDTIHLYREKRRKKKN